jgi:hypothetical protein
MPVTKEMIMKTKMTDSSNGGNRKTVSVTEQKARTLNEGKEKVIGRRIAARDEAELAWRGWEL